MKYRFLLPGEVLIPGDEIDWHDNGLEWRPVRYTLGERVDLVEKFRRPIGGFTPRECETAFTRIASVIRRIFLR